jgi:hypothetical protein
LKIKLGGAMEKLLMAGVILEALKGVKGLIVTSTKGQHTYLPTARGVKLFGVKGDLSGWKFTRTDD